jgi:hypothetical protein
MNRGPMDLEGSEATLQRVGGDDAAGNGRVPPPRTLGDWIRAPQTREEKTKNKRGKQCDSSFLGSGEVPWLMRARKEAGAGDQKCTMGVEEA